MSIGRSQEGYNRKPKDIGIPSRSMRYFRATVVFDVGCRFVGLSPKLSSALVQLSRDRLYLEEISKVRAIDED